MINWAGVASVILFYILILAVGMWASRKQSGVEGVDQEVKYDSVLNYTIQLAFLFDDTSNINDNAVPIIIF